MSYFDFSEVIPYYNYYKEYKDYGLSKKERTANIVDIRREAKIGRNELCPCGSEKKYKNCCGKH